MTDEYVTTDSDIRDQFILNYVRGYEQFSDKYYEACRTGVWTWSRWIKDHDRRAKADLLKEIIREVRDIPCWYPDNDPMGGEFDLDGESHRRVVLDTLLAYGSKFF